MTFGNVGAVELVFVLLAWGLPIILLVWFVRELTTMAAALRDIADRLETLERSVRDASVNRTR